MNMKSSDQSWGIVGGGILGLTLALRLAQRGKQVTLVEAAPYLGGLAAAWRLGEVVWDRHYHVTLLSDSHTRSTLSELGLEKEMEWVVTRTGCYAKGKHHSVSNTLEFLRFPLLGPVDKIRLAWTILYASRLKHWKRLEGITVADWLTRHSGKRSFQRFWLPLLRSKLGENYKLTSAAFIWTTIQRLYAARRTGLKREMFGYVPGGYSRILERFARMVEEEGVRVHLGQPVQRIAKSGSGIAVACRNGNSRSFDRVVVTAPAPLAAEICEGLTEKERSSLRNVRYQGIVCASFLLKKPLSEFYVTNILDEGFPFTGVIEASALVDRKHFTGYALVYLPKYLPVDDPFFEASDEDVENQFLSGLERMYSTFSREDVLCFKISRVRHVCPLPTLGYSSSVPEMKTSVPGLYTVNTSQILNGTLNVNETIQLAERAVEVLCRA